MEVILSFAFNSHWREREEGVKMMKQCSSSPRISPSRPRSHFLKQMRWVVFICMYHSSRKFHIQNMNLRRWVLRLISSSKAAAIPHVFTRVSIIQFTKICSSLRLSSRLLVTWYTLLLLWCEHERSEWELCRLQSKGKIFSHFSLCFWWRAPPSANCFCVLWERWNNYLRWTLRLQLCVDHGPSIRFEKIKGPEAKINLLVYLLFIIWLELHGLVRKI